MWLEQSIPRLSTALNRAAQKFGIKYPPTFTHRMINLQHVGTIQPSGESCEHSNNFNVLNNLDNATCVWQSFVRIMSGGRKDPSDEHKHETIDTLLVAKHNCLDNGCFQYFSKRTEVTFSPFMSYSYTNNILDSNMYS